MRTPSALACRVVILTLSAGLALLTLSGCSLRLLAVDQLGNALAGGGATFAGDDDPELVGAAVPFSLKLMESLLAESPEHQGLLLAASRGFTQYAFAFVQEEAEEREATGFAESQALSARARRLYLRARGLGLRGLEARHPGFRARLAAAPKRAVEVMAKSDVPLLYWSAVSWAGAIALGKDDPRLVGDLPQVEVLIDRALALDEAWDQGAIHSFLIAFEMGRATGEGDPAARARQHFERAVALSSGRAAAPFVGLAESVSVVEGDRARFEELLRRALAIDADLDPPTRLATLVLQRRARWLLARADKLFLPSLDSNP